MADDTLIRSVNPPPRIKDSRQRPEPERRRKPPAAKKPNRRKERQHIIDTYA